MRSTIVISFAVVAFLAATPSFAGSLLGGLVTTSSNGVAVNVGGASVGVSAPTSDHVVSVSVSTNDGSSGASGSGGGGLSLGGGSGGGLGLGGGGRGSVGGNGSGNGGGGTTLGLGRLGDVRLGGGNGNGTDNVATVDLLSIRRNGILPVEPPVVVPPVRYGSITYDYNYQYNYTTRDGVGGNGGNGGNGRGGRNGISFGGGANFNLSAFVGDIVGDREWTAMLDGDKLCLSKGSVLRASSLIPKASWRKFNQLIAKNAGQVGQLRAALSHCPANLKAGLSAANLNKVVGVQMIGNKLAALIE